jgi:drug/metabolite transporter (DMT)-like permease
VEKTSPKPYQLQPWLRLTILTTISWGIWGSLMEYPEKFGFPATLGYITWALTMIPCAYIAIKRGGKKINMGIKPIIIGCSAGFLGAGGQLMLFSALTHGPAYTIFPIISLYPVLTILLSTILLKERTNGSSWTGIVLSIVAVLLLSYQEPTSTTTVGHLWLFLSCAIFVMWGVQEFLLKLAQQFMNPESIFFYMMISALLLIPVALSMTNFSSDINWGLRGPWLSAAIQCLNAVGALSLVNALRTGKAILITPLTALAPVITIIISLVLYGVVPHPIIITGMALAIIAIFLIATEGSKAYLWSFSLIRRLLRF